MLTIGALARRARLTADAVRFYERLGLLAPASKTTSGYRLFTDDAVRRLRFIRHAQRCGFSLSEVREVLACDGDSARAYAVAVEKKAQIERSIDDLRAMDAVLATFIENRATGAEPGACSGAQSPLIDDLAGRMTEALRGTPPRGAERAAPPAHSSRDTPGRSFAP